MTTDYAKAYMNERLAHADMKRQLREAGLTYRASRIASADHPIRTAIGNLLINIGEHLSKTPAPLSSAIRDMA